MIDQDLDPNLLLKMYGAELAEDFLFDLLENVEEEHERQRIEQAVKNLVRVIENDKPIQASFDRLPPAIQHDCVMVWLFDDAFISYNKIAGYYHGYRKVDGHTLRLDRQSVQHYRSFIENPSQLLA